MIGENLSTALLSTGQIASHYRSGMGLPGMMIAANLQLWELYDSNYIYNRLGNTNKIAKHENHAHMPDPLNWVSDTMEGDVYNA